MLTAFHKRWPDDNDDADELEDDFILDNLAWETVATVRRSDPLRAGLAQILGMSERRVTNRLNREHGRTYVHNAFHDVWPEDEGDEYEGTDADGGEPVPSGPTPIVAGQGRAAHRVLQDVFCRIGEMDLPRFGGQVRLLRRVQFIFYRRGVVNI
ncbi:hypothetical protein [Haliangium sp.]|uniref:hypothetical protein n=1 Tax=Haliangium sp. TaxID=2663208 RepID=UPI003D0D731A